MTKIPDPATLPYVLGENNGDLFTHGGESARLTFDQLVLPHLLNKDAFLAMAPVVRLRASVDFVTVHPNKHRQSVWGVVTDDRPSIELIDASVVAKSRYSNSAFVGLDIQRPDAGLSCGTSHCLAGWGVNFAGRTFMVQAGLPAWDKEESDETAAARATAHIKEIRGDYEDLRIPLDFVLGEDGQVTNIQPEAQALFGLTDTGSALLFAGGNTLHALRRYASEAETRGWENSDSYEVVLTVPSAYVAR